MPDRFDSAALSQVDLTNCDQEPIHLLGAIQPVGFLVAITSDWLVARISANARDWFGQAPQDLLGRNFSRVISAEAASAIRRRLGALQGDDAVESAFGVNLFGDGRRFDLALHLAQGKFIIEGELCEDADELNAGLVVRALIGRLDRAGSYAAFCREAARQMRALTGFDRVMVYKFHEDGSGEVIAEASRAGLESFLGLRYPASDIPRQARILYQRNWLRLITDINAEPVPILPQLDMDGEPIDLSMAVLRSVSPIHIEYLRNMGVGASLSVSIMEGGKLWGLFACHHYGRRHVGYQRRTAAELFGQMFSLLLHNREREAEAEYEAGARRLHNRLLAAMAAEASAFDNVTDLIDAMADLIPCDGVGVWVDGQITLKGITPTREEFLGLVRFLNRTAASRVYSTHDLSAAYEPARDFVDRAAGVLAIPVSRSPRDYIVFFRREVARTVTWAGSPEKPVSLGPNGIRLTPRKSFAAWQEVVRGKSDPWLAAQMRVAESLRITLLEVIIRLADVAEGERRLAAERQELLIAELNHRVRNILGLIRGLVSQSRASAASVEDFATVLGGRIQALARAHDQITSDQWGPAPLRPLIEAEAGAFLNGKQDRIELVGPDVLLLPQAYSTLALVIHELMTNSAKYGSLCDRRGRVRVSWALDASDRLVIDWVESGGPPVQAPARRGFGSTIIERAIPHDLKGEAKIDYNLAGVRAHLVVPASLVAAGGSGGGGQAGGQPRAGGDAGQCLSGDVLLVEDNMIIALDAEAMLLELGASKVDAASGIQEAMSILALKTPRFAMLDVNLNDETSFPIADRLRAMGVPHVFATGYGEEASFPPEHAATPVVKKPYSMVTLAEAIARL